MTNVVYLDEVRRTRAEIDDLLAEETLASINVLIDELDGRPKPISRPAIRLRRD